MGTGSGWVVVDGAGALAAEATAQLRRCGVTVRGGTLAADAAELAVAGGEAPPALVVLAPGRGRAVPAWAGDPWLARGVPHLPVTPGASPVVGPLVVPGRSPCLTCVAAASTGHRPVTGSAPPDPAARVLAAAVVAVTVLSSLRGDESLAGISTEVAPGAAAVTHRLWNPDPGCRCSSVTMSA